MGTLPLLVVLAGAAGAGALPVMPTLSDLSYTFNERRCLLNVTWNPVTVINVTCDLQYESVVGPSRDWNSPVWSSNHFQTLQVALSKSVFFGVRTSCSEYVGEKKWINISLPQNGTAGTGAINVECIWHNKQYVVCTWQRGEKADHNTFYNLSYWYSPLEKEQPCTNYTRKGDSFRCSFNLDGQLLVPLSISIRGNSRDIQPVCLVKEGLEGGLLVKLDPPSVVNITKTSGGVSLKWTPSNLAATCYQVETNNTESSKEIYEDHTNITIPLRPNVYHTFRVRSILGDVGSLCKTTRGLWSDWSNVVEWGNRDTNNTLNILLPILIPLCAAILTIILVVYLKRIELWICPTIPDPRKFLKQMFGEQSEDLSKPSTEEPMKDEQMDVLILINPPD